MSIDAGTRETFAKIKGPDVFERVCDTLYQYSLESSKAVIKLKYILLTSINDNIADIDGFFELAKKVNVYEVFVCSDINNPDLVTEHTIEMAKYLCARAKSFSIPFLVNSPLLADALGVYCCN